MIYKIKCNKCEGDLLDYIKDVGGHEEEIKITPLNIDIVNFNFSHLTCSEGSYLELELKCKVCSTKVHITISSGFQQDMDMEINILQ